MATSGRAPYYEPGSESEIANAQLIREQRRMLADQRRMMADQHRAAAEEREAARRREANKPYSNVSWFSANMDDGSFSNSDQVRAGFDGLVRQANAADAQRNRNGRAVQTAIVEQALRNGGNMPKSMIPSVNMQLGTNNIAGATMDKKNNLITWGMGQNGQLQPIGITPPMELLASFAQTGGDMGTAMRIYADQTKSFTPEQIYQATGFSPAVAQQITQRQQKAANDRVDQDALKYVAEFVKANKGREVLPQDILRAAVGDKGNALELFLPQRPKIDEATGQVMKDADGNPMMEGMNDDQFAVAQGRIQKFLDMANGKGGSGTGNPLADRFIAYLDAKMAPRREDPVMAERARIFANGEDIIHYIDRDGRRVTTNGYRDENDNLYDHRGRRIDAIGEFAIDHDADGKVIYRDDFTRRDNERRAQADARRKAESEARMANDAADAQSVEYVPGAEGNAQARNRPNAPAPEPKPAAKGVDWSKAVTASNPTLPGMPAPTQTAPAQSAPTQTSEQAPATAAREQLPVDDQSVIDDSAPRKTGASAETLAGERARRKANAQNAGKTVDADKNPDGTFADKDYESKYQAFRNAVKGRPEYAGYTDADLRRSFMADDRFYAGMRDKWDEYQAGIKKDSDARDAAIQEDARRKHGSSAKPQKTASKPRAEDADAALRKREAETDLNVPVDADGKVVRPQPVSMAEAERLAKTSGKRYNADDGDKYTGWLGTFILPDGKGYTGEYSVGVNINGKDREIPTFVPGLTDEQLATLVNDIVPNRKPVPPDILEVAVKFARKRIAEGKSPFFNREDAEPADTKANLDDAVSDLMDTL